MTQAVTNHTKQSFEAEITVTLTSLTSKIERTALDKIGRAEIESANQYLNEIRPKVFDSSEQLLRELFRSTRQVVDTKLEEARKPQPIKLEDYEPPHFKVSHTELEFSIHDNCTIVESKLTMSREKKGVPLILDGHGLELLEVRINEVVQLASTYTATSDMLCLPTLPDAETFTVKIKTKCKPKENHSGEGIYYKNGTYISMCEPESFRCITYYIDRPDNLSTYRVSITADKKSCPELISNGSRVEAEEVGLGRHRVVYEDLYPKPSYLFMIAAGDLACKRFVHTDPSGKQIPIEVYCDKGQEHRVDFGVEVVKDAIDYDYNEWGRSYLHNELKLIVTDSFNMGACETTTAIVFNAQAFLADPLVTPDTNLDGRGGYSYIRTACSHEFFHYWRGNLITIRPWQIALKEGLTTFTEGLYSTRYLPKSTARISTVKTIKEQQFPEDSGAGAHPILPRSYTVPMNNYTNTTYKKGAEFFRMMYCLLGHETFRKGTDAYFRDNRGKAATIEDFFNAINNASGRDLAQFRNWIDYAGTPKVEATLEYNAGTATLKLKQSCRPTKECVDKPPFFIPFQVALFDSNGALIPGSERMIEFTEREMTIIFDNVPAGAVPSLNRDFVAPIRVEYPYSIDDLELLMRHDTDPVNRWDASQRIIKRELKKLVAQAQEGRKLTVDSRVVSSLEVITKDNNCDNAFKACILTPPSINEIVDEMEVADFEAAAKARTALMRAVGDKLTPIFMKLDRQLGERGEFSTSPEAIGRRALKNTAVEYLVIIGNAYYASIQFDEAKTMTEKFHAMRCLCEHHVKNSDNDMKVFEKEWSQDALAMNMWFAAQTWGSAPQVFTRIKKLTEHRSFDQYSPNNLKALYRTFYTQNPVAFHDKQGCGYQLIADAIIDIDAYNPEIAAMFVSAFDTYNKLPAPLKIKMREQLLRIKNQPKLTKNVLDKVQDILGDEIDTNKV